MGIIKFKLLFIISSLFLVFLPASAMANTLQPGQNFNNNEEEQQNEYSEPAEQDAWTEPEESYDDGGNENYYDDSNNYNDYNDNYNNNNENNYGDDYYNNDGSGWETEQDVTEQYEEPVQEEPVIEEPVEPEYEEPSIEEPVEEVPVIEEPVQQEPEPSVDVNTLDAEAFSISGQVVDEDDAGVSDVELVLSGKSFDEESVYTDTDGSFLFEEIPSGNYQIGIKPTDDYEISESTLELEVTDRSKRGLTINLTEVEEEEAVEEDSEPVETDEDVMAAETGSLSSMDWTLIGTGIVFALISLFVLLFKKVRKN